MKKIDFKKSLKDLYSSSAKSPSVVEVPKMNFLMIDGMGDPNTSIHFGNAVEALFSLSYALKFTVKKGDTEIDYGVMPLEGLWWKDDMSTFDATNKDDWKWTVMIMQPAFITVEMVEDMRGKVARKKKLPALEMVRFQPFAEGKAAQLLHVGPFSEEGPTIERLHDFIAQQGWERRDKHHEIYLSDIRRAAPEKWKTILRQPVSPS
jgi:hypothetical protein